jgi:RNA recognition motif-containing protein
MSRDGRSKGCGIVEFERPEDAAAAILKLHDSLLGGRPLCVREDREDRDLVGVLPDRGDRGGRAAGRGGGGGGGGGGRDRTRSRDRAPAAPAAPPSDAAIFVGNLPFTTTAETLHAFCASVGEVVRADVPANAAGKSRGYGIVEFASPSVAEAAVAALHDRELEGRKMLVRADRGAMRK